jgi:hypothetical protein
MVWVEDHQGTAAPDHERGAGMGEAKRGAVVKVGRLYVRDYPERFAGDYTLTPNRLRAAQFHVEDTPAQVADELTAALGIRAQVFAVDEED